jgi:hypothetical protein
MRALATAAAVQSAVRSLREREETVPALSSVALR